MYWEHWDASLADIRYTVVVLSQYVKTAYNHKIKNDIDIRKLIDVQFNQYYLKQRQWMVSKNYISYIVYDERDERPHTFT